MIFNALKLFIKHPRTYHFIHTYVYRMDKVYVRREVSGIFEFTFQYVNPKLKINRQFNFSRKLSECVETLLSRITTNLQKTLNKKKKKSEREEPENSINEIQIYQNGNEVQKDLSCEELFITGGDIKLKISDQVYTIIIDSPYVKRVFLPSCLLANFYTYPNKLQCSFTDSKISNYTWYKSKDKKKWEQLASGYYCKLSNDEIDYFLKLNIEPRNSKEIGPCTEVISNVVVGAGPGICPFEARHAFTQEKLEGKNFRIVSYNLLADLYADSDYSRSVLFPYCPPYALNIDYRKQLMLKELKGFNADIICLQEVDDKVFFNDLQPCLGTFGMKGLFEKKGNIAREGVACFYDVKRFKLVAYKNVVLGEELKNPLFTNIYEQISVNENLNKRLSERTTSLQIIILQSLEYDEYFVVANTHLYFHPDADHIRLLQGTFCILYLNDFVQKFKKEVGTRVSLIFCGDFNSTPDCGIYKLFTTGTCPSNIIDWQSNKEEAIDGIGLEHSMIMGSACGTPKYTNYTEGFQECLDYIYYEREHFEVAQVIPVPSEEELSANIAIPSVVFPSDHVSLVADLRLL